MPEQCKTCIFRPENPMRLRPGRLAEIQKCLINGTSHRCHTPKRGKRACRGGRDFQLMVWSRMGVIADATDEALEAAMAAHEQAGEANQCDHS